MEHTQQVLDRIILLLENTCLDFRNISFLVAARNWFPSTLAAFYRSCYADSIMYLPSEPLHCKYDLFCLNSFIYALKPENNIVSDFIYAIKPENNIVSDFEFLGSICFLSPFFELSNNTTTSKTIYRISAKHIQTLQNVHLICDIQISLSKTTATVI